MWIKEEEKNKLTEKINKFKMQNKVIDIRPSIAEFK